MSRQSKNKKPSPETANEANKIAKSIQRPAQTKEQTRLIAQGIQKGIDLYKKQNKAKSRELDKLLKKSKKSEDSLESVEIQNKIAYRQHWLPWSLLALSWLSGGYYFFVP